MNQLAIEYIFHTAKSFLSLFFLFQTVAISMALKLWLPALVLSHLLLLAAGQSCGVVTTALCEPIISRKSSFLQSQPGTQYTLAGTIVFVPEGLTIEFIQLAALRTVQLINLATDIGEPCRSYGIQMLCATWLRPCFSPSPNGIYLI